MFQAKLLHILTSASLVSLTSVLSITAEISFKNPLTLSSPAVAGQPRQVRWIPNRKMGSVGSTLSGGRRGSTTASCETGDRAKSTTAITLLVPNNNEGLFTVSGKPTFFWHVNAPQGASVQFILSDSDRAEPIVTKLLPVSTTGMMSMELPANVQLQVGTHYRWTVLVACNGGTTSEVHARSFIERVENSSLQQKVKGHSEFQKASIYAADGLWYDALTSLILAYQQDPTNANLAAELQSLLNQSGNRSAERIISQNRFQIANWR